MYQSKIRFTTTGLEYQPISDVQLISITTAQTKTRCSAACNQLSSCRVLDYDTVSKRCRLFEGDSTTGSIISSSSSTSLVGTVHISPTLYSSIDQSCQSCQEDRYEICSSNTSTCQCPDHTYWNGLVCALQLFENETCGQLDSCRSDLNLTCLPNCYGSFTNCVSSIIYNTIFSSTMPFGTTVAGACNGTASGNQTILSSPAGVLLDYNNTLYTGDSNNRLLVFTLNNLTGQVLRTFGSWPTFFFLDNRTSNIYISVLNLNLVYIWPTNQTIPPNGVNYGNCSMYCLNTPTGITVDSVGNVYIASYSCNWVQKWAPNATSATLVAGLTNGNSGANSQSFTSPYGLALDEANAFLYVVDRFNNRIQRFVVGGSGIGVTVAGGTNGIAANQLSYPTDVHISKIDGSLYIVDSFNNRIQKWEQNATSGITVAGSPNGTSGNTPYLLKQPYSLTIDYEGNYLYVSDSGNNRIQRFPLY